MAKDSESETRATTRHKTYKGARIVFKDGAFIYECLVKDLSKTGARLVLSATGNIPNRFQLHLDEHAPPIECEVAWRDATSVGVTFVAKE